MNFLLLERSEIGADGTARLTGRRADHLRSVLRAAPGQVLRAGVVDGPLGTATVAAVTGSEVLVTTALDREPAPVQDALLLCVPRPKVLLRLLAHAAALGFARILLCRSWRVERSHLDSSAMQPEAQRAWLLAGLEQAGRTLLPRVSFHPLWKPMVEDALPSLALPPNRFVGHPRALVGSDELALPRGAPFALAMGPDGGFTDYEIGTLVTNGFSPVHAGPWPLRTETALAVLTGQLDLLRRRGTVPPP